MIRCKFTCVSITKRKAWVGAPSEFIYDTEFQAVTNHDTASSRAAANENVEFWAATPSGMLKLGTVRADHFEVGKNYYLDISIVEHEEVS